MEELEESKTSTDNIHNLDKGNASCKGRIDSRSLRAILKAGLGFLHHSIQTTRHGVSQQSCRSAWVA